MKQPKYALILTIIYNTSYGGETIFGYYSLRQALRIQLIQILQFDWCCHYISAICTMFYLYTTMATQPPLLAESSIHI